MAGNAILEGHIVRLQGPDAYEYSIYNLVDGECRLASVLKYARVIHG
jgi:hypothetical protein